MSSKASGENAIYQLIVINDQQYALPVHNIICVSALENMLSLPKTPHWIKGVVHIRNAIVPIINLNELINDENSVVQKAYDLCVLLRHPLDLERWLAIGVTDLGDVINHVELAEMLSRPSTHKCLLKVLDSDPKPIHLLDLNALFEELGKESG